jgi:hypothetical protein
MASLVAFTFVMSGANLIGSPDRRPVVSRSIASIGYDPQRRVLDVEFQSGAIYRYLQVPREVANRFLEAESKGRYFARTSEGSLPFNSFDHDDVSAHIRRDPACRGTARCGGGWGHR